MKITETEMKTARGTESITKGISDLEVHKHTMVIENSDLENKKWYV